MTLEEFLKTNKVESYELPPDVKSEEEAIEMVTCKPFSLVRIKPELRTHKVCLAAVNTHGLSLQYVLKQNEEICIAACNDDGLALQYVHNQTPEIIKTALNQTGLATIYINRSVFEEQPMKHNHYFADVRDIDHIDLYEVCERFGINDASGCTQHATKKIIFAGKRGAKDQIQDINEAITTLERLKEILKKRELNESN